MTEQQTLAQMIRAKYPDAYTDMSDAQLEAAIKSKYPGVYDDLPTTTEAPKPAASSVSFNDLAAKGPSAMPATAEGFKTVMAPENWPAIGGAVGGTVGAAGGPPGAVGGAALGGAFGESARQLYERSIGGGDVPASPVDAAKDIGLQGGIQGAIEGAGGAITKGASALGTAIYRGYLKPSLAAVNLKKAREIVETGIREALPISKTGEATAARLIAEINGQVREALKQADGVIDLHKVAERVRAFARRTYDRPGAPASDLAAALKVADDIDKHPSLGIPEGVTPTRVDVSPVKANESKQALDKAIGDTGFGVERGAATEARKVGRHATREAIEKQVPVVGKLNERESRLIDAMEALQQAAGREENRNLLFGVPTMLAAGFGGVYGHGQGNATEGLLAAMVARGFMTPAVASRAAIYAGKMGRAPSHVASNALRIGLVLALRESDQLQESK